MGSETILVAGDGHFHLYPCYDLSRAIGNLVKNLRLLAEENRDRAPRREPFKIAFMAESRQHDYYRNILDRQIDFGALGFETAGETEKHSILFIERGRLSMALVAGRQIVTEEKIELLGLGMEEVVPDGLAAEATVEKIIAADGLPVLAFSPGKWLFRRADVVRRLVNTKFDRPLLIGDSALRPLEWGKPAVMRRVGAVILPGSDPLPLTGEEKYAGCYGFVYAGPFDISRPLASMRQIIADNPGAIIPAGRRGSAVNVAGRLLRLSKAKKT